MQPENTYHWEEDIREEGRQEIMAELQKNILNTLEHRFGALPAAIASSLAQIPSSQELSELTVLAATDPSLEVFQNKLHAALQN